MDNNLLPSPGSFTPLGGSFSPIGSPGSRTPLSYEPAPIPRRRLYEGGFFSDVMDTLALPQVLLTQYFTGRDVSVTGERITPGEVLAENMQPGFARGAVQFVGDVVADPLNLALLPVKGITIGARALAGLSDLNRALGAVKPIETVAMALANSPTIRFIEANSGMSLTRVGRGFRDVTLPIKRKAILLEEQIMHNYSTLIRNHKAPEAADMWVSRYINAGSHWQMEATRNWTRYNRPNDNVKTLRELIDLERGGLLDSEEFLQSAFVQAYKSPEDARKALVQIAKPFIKGSDEMGRMMQAANVWGSDKKSAAIMNIWEGAHLQRIYAFSRKPQELMEWAKIMPDEEAAYYAAQIKGRALADPKVLDTEFYGVAQGLDPNNWDDMMKAGRDWVYKQGEFWVNEWKTTEGARALDTSARGALRNVDEDRVLLDPMMMRLLGSIESVNKQMGYMAKEVSAEVGARAYYRSVANSGLAFESRVSAIRQTNGSMFDDFVQIPDNKSKFGELAGKWMHEIPAQDVINFQRPVDEIIPGTAKVVGTWKAFMAPRNPATQARNFFGNMMLAHIAGDLGPWRMDTYWTALEDMLKVRGVMKGVPKYLPSDAETLSTPMHALGTMVKSEISDVIGPNEARAILDSVKGKKSLTGLLDAANKIFKGMDDAYDFSEKWFKHAVYIGGVQRGLGMEAAEDLAQKALFNYSEVPRLIDVLRRTGAAPFITYPYKALPLLAKETIRNPQRIAFWGRKLPEAVTAMNPEAERRAYYEYNSLPDYVKEGFVRLPTSKSQYLAFAPYFPFNEMMGVPTGADPVSAIAEGMLGVSGPGVQFGIDLATGRQNFTGYPLYNESDSLAMKTRKNLQNAANSFIPQYRNMNQLRKSFTEDAPIRTPFQEIARIGAGVNVYDVEARRRRLQQQAINR